MRGVRWSGAPIPLPLVGLGLLLLVLPAVGCDSGGHWEPPPPDPEPSGLVLTAPSDEVVVGYTLAVEAELPVIRPFGVASAVEPAATDPMGLAWSTSDARVATVDATGLVRGRRPGRVTVTAWIQETELTGSLELRVVFDSSFHDDLSDLREQADPVLDREILLRSCRVTLNVEGVEATVATVQSRSFHRLSMPNAGVGGEEGKPALPFYTLYFAIPVAPKTEERARWQVSVERASPRTYEGMRPWPHQPPRWIDGRSEEEDEAPPFVQDEKAYAAEEPWPTVTHTAEAVEVGNLPLLAVRVIPVRYLPTAMRLELFRQIRVEVSFQSDGDLEMPSIVGDYKGLKERGADERVAEIVQNNELLSPVRYADLVHGLNPPDDLYFQDHPFDLLIITRPSLYASAVRLARWRQSQGTRVWLANLPETSYPNPASIRAYIETMDDGNRLETIADRRPRAMRAVLLFGDVEHIPTFQGMTTRGATPDETPGEGETEAKKNIYVCGTDLPYSTFRGEDTLADVALGRISVDEDTEGQDVVAKIEAYEGLPADAHPHAMVSYAFFDDVPEHRVTIPGVVVFEPGEAAVRGLGTAFLGQVDPGDVVRPDPAEGEDDWKWRVRVREVVDDNLILLEQPWDKAFVLASGLQVGRQDGQDDWSFAWATERVREFMQDQGIPNHFDYRRNDQPAPAPLPCVTSWATPSPRTC